MVALDEDGKPAPVPPLIAETHTEKRRMREAALRRANRLAERAQIRAGRDHDAELDSRHAESAGHSEP
jgi:hypothetical protein